MRLRYESPKGHAPEGAFFGYKATRLPARVPRRVRLLVALIVVASAGTQAQIGSRDRYFIRYPFDRWQAAGERAQIHWSPQVHRAKLSVHQRMVARIEIELDAKEIQKRRGRGELVTLLQVQNAAGTRWRTHHTFDLTSIPEDAKPHAAIYYQDVFLLPGDYTVAFATCDGETGEYSFSSRTLHVAALRADPLARAWNDLPPVEFVRPLEAPDNWFQPYIRGQVHLGLETERPVHVDLVMNMTASEHALGSLHTFRRNMSVLVPALKLLAAMEVQRGSIDVTLLDLTRQRVWEQKNARGLDWMKMRAPLADNQPGVIDAQSLAAKAQMSTFFRDQVVGRARPSGIRDELRIVIVLSAPAFLGHQFRLEPVNLDPDPNRKIFYLRYRPSPPRPDFNVPMPEEGPRTLVTAMPSDDLEHALKPLDARVLTSTTPEEFRKALSAMLADIHRM